MRIFIQLSGFFFLFIIVTNILSGVFGYISFGEVDVIAQLQEIHNFPKKFKISFVLILIEHFSIISLTIALFFTFSPYNVVLGFVWLIARIVEPLIQIYDKRNYWGLLDIAMRYSITNADEKDALTNSARAIFKTKDSLFKFAQIFFSIGTFAYSLLFVIYGVVPIFIGWFGIIASIIYGFGNGINQVKPNIKGVWNLGGLLVLIFEIVLGGWLLVFSPFAG